jgi:hypothetical protein
MGATLQPLFHTYLPFFYPQQAVLPPLGYPKWTTLEQSSHIALSPRQLFVVEMGYII